MKQYTIFSESPQDLLDQVALIQNEPFYRDASDRLLLIASQERGGPALHERVDRLERALPGVKIVGMTMPDVDFSQELLHVRDGAAYSLLLFESGSVEVCFYDFGRVQGAEAGRQLGEALRGQEDAAGILLFSAGVTREIDSFLSGWGESAGQEIPIIGAEAGSSEVPFIFGSFGGSSRGVVALVLRGAELHLRYDYDMGWQPIGKGLRVTGTEGSYCVTSINGESAASIYEKYLGVERDQFFVDNVREFPLVTVRGNRKVVRCPSGCDEAGRLSFIARMHEGEVVHLSYANPRRLVRDTRRRAGEMMAFSPEAVVLIVCENRARFMGDLMAADLSVYSGFLPQTAWACGYAGILLDSQGGGVVNSAILSVGLREGSPKDVPEAPELPEQTRQHRGTIPLNERLARFLEQTTQELADAATEADAANSAKSAFLSNMSHEIRTPINAILGMNEMILRESTEDEIRDYANNIRIAGMSLLSIISDILDFSKIEAGQMELDPRNYEVTSLISDLVNLIWIRVEEKGLSLNVHADAALPHLLYGDETRIKQIITNLLTNAVKFTEQGSVELSIGFTKVDDGTVDLHVSVQDTGYGIRPEDIQRLFRAFDRIDRERARRIEGTGLGLNITQQLLALMGSRLEVESVYGEGSRFSFTLRQPVAEWTAIGDNSTAPHGERRKKNRSANRFVAPSAHILVVDDAPMNLAVISGLLKRTQIRIDTAPGGQECIEKFGHVNYDLVFLDHRMPVMDGVETLDRMRSLYPDKVARTPVISLTANAISGARELYLEAGFDDYLTKPVMADELENMLFRWLPPEKIEQQGDDALPPEPERVPPRIAAISALETEKGLAHCGGVSAYLEALKIFADSVATRALDIETACAAGDIGGYTILVHALKSMARSIGAEELAGLSARLEIAGDTHDADTVYSQTGKLLTMYRRLGLALQSALREEQTPSGEVSENAGGTLSEADFADALSALREFSGSCDYDSIQMVMDELTRYAPPAGAEDVFRALSGAVRRVDYTGITGIADDYLKKHSLP